MWPSFSMFANTEHKTKENKSLLSEVNAPCYSKLMLSRENCQNQCLLVQCKYYWTCYQEQHC